MPGAASRPKRGGAGAPGRGRRVASLPKKILIVFSSRATQTARKEYVCLTFAIVPPASPPWNFTVSRATPTHPKFGGNLGLLVTS